MKLGWVLPSGLKLGMDLKGTASRVIKWTISFHLQTKTREILEQNIYLHAYYLIRLKCEGFVSNSILLFSHATTARFKHCTLVSNLFEIKDPGLRHMISS